MVIDTPPEAIERALANGDTVRVRAAGHSMGKTLPRGQAVLVRSGLARDGDVILIRGVGRFTLHRLIGQLSARGRTRLVHCGDARFALPGLCRKEDVIGVADLPQRPLPTLLKAPLLLLAAALSLLPRSHRH